MARCRIGERCSCDLRPMPFAGVQVFDYEFSFEPASQGKRQDLAASLRWQEKRVRKKTGALSFVWLDQQFWGAPAGRNLKQASRCTGRENDCLSIRSPDTGEIEARTGCFAQREDGTSCYRNLAQFLADYETYKVVSRGPEWSCGAYCRLYLARSRLIEVLDPQCSRSSRDVRDVSTVGRNSHAAFGDIKSFRHKRELSHRCHRARPKFLAGRLP